MKLKDLKVGDVVYIREDLEYGEIYGDYMYMDGMCSGAQQIKGISRDCENFKVFSSFDYFYTPEMIDWDKTIKLRREKMKIKDLKVGDKVFIREDLVHSQAYGNVVYYKAKGSGEKTIAWFYNDNKDTFVAEENICYYTSEMIDWEKTKELRYMENVSGVHEEQDKVNSPSHYKLEGLDIESVDVIKSVLGKEKFIGWVWGNSLKYLLRQEKKNGIEDVKKAMKNLEWLVEMLERED